MKAVSKPSVEMGYNPKHSYRRLSSPRCQSSYSCRTDAIRPVLAYHVAVAKGTDVGRPRKLAKSVTVE